MVEKHAGEPYDHTIQSQSARESMIKYIIGFADPIPGYNNLSQH